MHSYEQFIVATGEVPAGSDASLLYPIFTSPGPPVEIMFVQWYGGDSAEFVQLVLVPPNVRAGLPTSAVPGTIAITPAEFMGPDLTQAKPGCLGADNGGRGPPRFQPFVVPPYYQVMAQADTANTAAWVITVGGFVMGGRNAP
jgi:hypothetical protein